MSPAVDDLVWVRRMRCANLRKVECARVVSINLTCILPYRLRFADGDENQFHESEFLRLDDRGRLAA